MEIQLSPTQKVVVGLLKGGDKTAKEIAALLYGGQDGEAELNCVRNLMWAIRRRGVQISTRRTGNHPCIYHWPPQ